MLVLRLFRIHWNQFGFIAFHWRNLDRFQRVIFLPFRKRSFDEFRNGRTVFGEPVPVWVHAIDDDDVGWFGEHGDATPEQLEATCISSSTAWSLHWEVVPTNVHQFPVLPPFVRDNADARVR